MNRKNLRIGVEAVSHCLSPQFPGRSVTLAASSIEGTDPAISVLLALILELEKNDAG